MVYSIGDIKVEIKDIENGVYILGFDGATGKTYFYKSVKALCNLKKYSDIFLAVTFNDDYTDEEYVRKVSAFKGKFIVMDRFDLYISNELIRTIEEAIDKVIFIDLKDERISNNIKCKLAYVDLKKDIVEVGEL